MYDLCNTVGGINTQSDSVNTHRYSKKTFCCANTQTDLQVCTLTLQTVVLGL